MQPGAFFREPGQFELLARAVLPELARQARRRRIRLWAAGCGAGESAWSIAMVVEEAELPPELAVDIVATEGDPPALAAAEAAVYRDDELAQVSGERRHRHFVRGAGRRLGQWRVIAPLRDRVELAALDLAGPWPAAAPYDAVFCHGAIAELDPAGARLLAGRLAAAVTPGGALFLGRELAPCTELAALTRCGPASYRRPES